MRKLTLKCGVDGDDFELLTESGINICQYVSIASVRWEITGGGRAELTLVVDDVDIIANGLVSTVMTRRMRGEGSKEGFSRFAAENGGGTGRAARQRIADIAQVRKP